MRLSRGLLVLSVALALAGCATVSRPPAVRPPPAASVLESGFAQALTSYLQAADAASVAAALDATFASSGQGPADLSTDSLTTYAHLLLAAGRYPAAEASLTLLDQRRPGDRDTLLTLALLAGARGDTVAQAARVDALSRAFPDDPRTLDLKARLALAQGRRAEAQSLWRQAAAQTDNGDALQALAGLALEDKKPAEALTWADRAVRAAPNDDAALALRARAYAGLERYAEARADLDLAVNAAPSDPFHRLDRGKLLWLRFHDAVAARADLETAVLADADNVFAWEALAEVYEELQQARRALDAWLRVLALQPGYRFAYPSTAMLSFRFQDWARAAQYAREAARDYPAEYAFPVIEALSERAQGRPALGQAVLEKARGRVARGSTVDELYRFLTTPNGDYGFNAAMNLEKADKVRLRLRFYQGAYYALTKSPASAKAAFDEVAASSLLAIPEVAMARDWMDHGF